MPHIDTFDVGVLRAGDLGARGCVCSIPRDRVAGGLAVGDIVSVTSRSGKTALARLGVHDGGQDALLDRPLRLTLRTRVGDTIQVAAVMVQPVTEVIFTPAADLSRMLMEGVEGALKEALVDCATPLSPDLVLYLKLGESAGAFFKVIDMTGGPGVADPETSIRVTYTTESQFTEISQGVSYADVGGLGTQLATVRELVEMPLVHPYLFRRIGINPPKGLIFHGPPGTGKTHVARAIASELEARFFYINGADVAGNIALEAENALRRTFAEATHRAPSIIFIDEIDALAPRRGDTGLHSDTRLVSQLLTLMDGLHQLDGVTVIATTNRVDALDPALRRPGRFEREILFTLPDAKGRLAILDIHTREMPLAPAAAAFLHELAELTAGYTGADLMELCREAALSAIRQLTRGSDPRTFDPSTAEPVVTPSDLREALREVRPSSLREVLVQRPTVRWADIGGLAAAKRSLQQLLGVRPELLRALGLPSALGILLHGPSGSGKTMLAKASATEFDLHFISIRGPEILSKWVGESEQSVRRVFAIARQVAPCLVLFDQLEAIAPRRRADSGVSAPERVLHQLLVELDELESEEGIVVMGAATSIEALDPALVRSGRFGRHVHVPLPDTAERAEIFEIHLRQAQPWFRGDLRAVITDLATATSGLSGADLRSICDEARYVAAARSGDGHDLYITAGDLEAPAARLTRAVSRPQEECRDASTRDRDR